MSTLNEISSENVIAATSTQAESDFDGSLSLWVSSILNAESKSAENLNYLQTICRPLNENDKSKYAVQTEQLFSEEAPKQVSEELAGCFTHEIIFKIDEKVFIEKILVYEKVCADSSLMKIEAYNETTDEWTLVWETRGLLDSVLSPIVFVPDIKPTPFRTDTIKIVVSGNLVLIDAIEIKGNKLADDDNKQIETDYSTLSRNLFKLVQNDLFADVYFEVEGRVIPAHRNILVCRSEYFRAMLSESSLFKESLENHNSPASPIYIKDIAYNEFAQILAYLYTGHIEHKSIPVNLLIGIMRVADTMNLCELQKLCLFHLSELIDKKNVISIYREAIELPNVLDEVISMCYDVISEYFAFVSRTEDFCALPQDLMIRVIENVVPKLSRLTSHQVEQTN